MSVMNTGRPWFGPKARRNLRGMTRARATSIGLIVLALAGAARAQPAPSGPPTTVRPVTAVAGPPPKMTASYPADGSSVASGVIVLKVVFDQPMTPKGWAYGPSGTTAFPNCLAEPRLLADKHTFALLCTTAPNQSYAVQINPAPDFVNDTGRSATPVVIHFSTTGAVTPDMHDALVAAGLTDDDEPLMSWDDPGKGVSQVAPNPDSGAQPTP